MAKDMKLAFLLDFYGGLLTEKQAAALDGYYNQDMSLSELAEDMGISRQGVMAFLRQGEKHLMEFEDKLGLAKRFSEISEGLREMRREVEALGTETERQRLIGLIERISENI